MYTRTHQQITAFEWNCVFCLSFGVCEKYFRSAYISKSLVYPQFSIIMRFWSLINVFFFFSLRYDYYTVSCWFNNKHIRVLILTFPTTPSHTHEFFFFLTLQSLALTLIYTGGEKIEYISISCTPSTCNQLVVFSSVWTSRTRKYFSAEKN